MHFHNAIFFKYFLKRLKNKRGKETFSKVLEVTQTQARTQLSVRHAPQHLTFSENGT